MDCTVGWFYVFHYLHMFKMHLMQEKPFDKHFQALTDSLENRAALQQSLRSLLHRQATLGHHELLGKFLELLKDLLETYPELPGFEDLWEQQLSGLAHLHSRHSALMMSLMTIVSIAMMRTMVDSCMPSSWLTFCGSLSAVLQV